MRTSEESYQHDYEYHNFVDSVEALLHRAQYTPGEMREMVMLGCIHFEQKATRTYCRKLQKELQAGANNGIVQENEKDQNVLSR